MRGRAGYLHVSITKNEANSVRLYVSDCSTFAEVSNIFYAMHADYLFIVEDPSQR